MALRHKEMLTTHPTHATALDSSWRLATPVLHAMAVCELLNAGLTIFEPTICSSGPHAKPAQLWWLRHLSCITGAPPVRQLASLALPCLGIALWLCFILLLRQGSKAVAPTW